MIPQGPIYFKIRSDVLSTYAQGCRVSPKSRVTFADWLLNGSGSYHVTSVKQNEIILEAAIYDLSSALLTDIECLSNHCFEHLQELACFYLDDRPRSDAWNVVTIYYFAFFAAQIFLRLIGSPVIFIGPEHIGNLKMLGGVSSGGPGAGAYYLEKINDLSASHAEYRIKKTKNQKIHEITWIRIFSFLNQLIKNPSLATVPNETLFYNLITTSILYKIYDNEGWPSVIRTKANYRAGFAYLLVEKGMMAKTKKLLIPWKNIDSSKILSLLNSSVSSCSPAQNTPFSEHVRLLHDMAQSLFLLCRQLYFELLQRNNINRIWEHHRREFRQTMSFPSEFSRIAETFR